MSGIELALAGGALILVAEILRALGKPRRAPIRIRVEEKRRGAKGKGEGGA